MHKPLNKLAMLAELTARTKNVAIILDCCHAAQMSRAADPGVFVPRALSRAWADGFEIIVDHQQIMLFDSDGVQIANPEPDDDAGRRRTSELLERWAKALALRDLQPGGLPPAVATVH